MDERPVFENLDKITRFLRGLLLAGFILAVLAIWSGWLQIQLLSTEFTDEQATANDNREQLIGSLAVCLIALTMIVFATWIYRAHRNLPALGVRDPDISPGWAIGWFFIPIINLWRPYMAMRTLWQASSYPQNWRVADTIALLPIWWTLYLVSGVLGRVVFRVMKDAKTVEQLISGTKLSMGSGVVDLALYAAAFVLVGKIWEAQSSHAYANPAIGQNQTPATS